METILMLMQQIEEEHPLSLENEIDGRYTWPDRWDALEKKIKELIQNPTSAST